MHEQSLMRTLIRAVESICVRQNAQSVREIRLEVGPLSGVEPLLLETAFQQLATSRMTAGAELIIDQVPLLVHCDHCVHRFTLDSFHFRCPLCGRGIRIVQGETLQLISVVLTESVSDVEDSVCP